MKILFNYFRKKLIDSYHTTNLQDIMLLSTKNKKNGGVYLIFDKDTYQPYIGESNNVIKRFQQHVNVQNPTQYIDREIRKKGIEQFKVAFILKENNFTLRRQEEAKYVKLFNSYYNGYNGSKTGHPLTQSQRYRQKAINKWKRKNLSKTFRNHSKYKGWYRMYRFVKKRSSI